MKKVNSTIKVCGWMVLVFIIIICLNGCEKKQNPQSTEEQTEQFISKIQELRENPEKTKEYFEIINKLTGLVKEEAGRNPEMMESFLEDMIEIAAKTSPGLALQVEDYANTELKQEMEGLRKESSVAQLLEKEKKNLALVKKTKRLQQEIIELQETQAAKDKEIARLRDEISEKDWNIVQFMEKEKKMEVLQQELSRLQGVQAAKDEEMKKLKKKLQGSDTVSVCLISPSFSTRTRIKMINVSIEEVAWFSVESGRWRVVNIPPGEYKIEYYKQNQQNFYAEGALVVTKNASSFYRSKQYHGIVQIPR